MGIFLIFLNIVCAVLYGISAYANYMTGAMGGKHQLICFAASVG